MSKKSPLTAINARVKVLAKKHPNTKRTTLQKQAGREYKAGKLGTKYKVYHKVRKVGAAKKKHTRKKSTRPKSNFLLIPLKSKRKGNRRRSHAAPKRKQRTRTRTVTRVVVRRVGATGSKNLMPVLLGGAILLGGIYLMTRGSGASSQQKPLIVTGNVQRDQATSSVVQYAQAAGLGIDAITNLISALNAMNDNQAISTAAQVEASGGSIPAALVQPPTGGPSITTLGYNG